MKLAPYYEKLARIETCWWTRAVPEPNGPAAAVGDSREINIRAIGFRTARRVE